MFRHYEIFYCLEKSIRDLTTTTTLETSAEESWGDEKVPPIVKGRGKEKISKKCGLKRYSAIRGTY